MRKIFRILSAALITAFAVSCMEFDSPGVTSSISSEDDSLAGEAVATGNLTSVYYKMFVLNEGQMGKNNASLDFFRYTNGKYVTNAFAKMNPSVTLGLGDTANDIKFYYNTAWICLTGSGIVQVINATNEKVIKTLDIPGCRKVAFDQSYAYITAYAGAVYGGDEIKGRLYKVNLSSMAMEYVEVGYQPEGVAVANGYVYVANSGGYMPGYSNTISVLNATTLTLYKEFEAVSNPKDIYVDNIGNLWITSPGDYYSTHSGIYLYSGANHARINNYPDLENVRISTSYSIANYIFAIGTEDEWNWYGATGYNLYVINCSEHTVKVFPFKDDLAKIQTPYGIAYNPYTGEFFISDAADYVNPGTVYCFDGDLKLKWKTLAGVNPGHMDFYYAY